MEGAGVVVYENDLNLRLGLPGTDVKNQEKPVSSGVGNNSNKKRPLDEITREDSVSIGKGKSFDDKDPETSPSPPKAQIVGWPPVRSYRKNTLQQQQIYVKVSMDGAPYLRKIDIKVYKNYPELLQALETMFKFTIGEYSGREGYTGSEYVPTYEDKDGDWMLVGDVPWSMFMSSCKRLRVMKGSEAKGLGCDAS